MKTADLLQKLNTTPEAYEIMMFNAYARWCESVSTNQKEFQNILANSKIANWYMVEWQKGEAEFRLLTDRYENLSTEDYQRMYTDCTFRMYNIRPMALLNEIKRPTAKPMQVHGIPVLTLTLNLN